MSDDPMKIDLVIGKASLTISHKAKGKLRESYETYNESTQCGHCSRREDMGFEKFVDLLLISMGSAADLHLPKEESNS